MANEQTDGWVAFSGKPFGGPGHFGMRVSINNRCVVYLNVKAWEALRKPDAVEFLYNEATLAIGIRRASTRLESAFPVKPKIIQGEQVGYIIHASAFLTDRKLKPTQTLQFNKIDVDRKGFMTLPLVSLTAIARGAR